MRLTLTISTPYPDERTRGISWVDRGGSIGRSRRSDWALVDLEGQISRTHARIEFDRDVFFLVDTSTNGVLINGCRVPRGLRQALADADRITIGSHRIEVRINRTLELFMPAREPEPGRRRRPLPALEQTTLHRSTHGVLDWCNEP